MRSAALALALVLPAGPGLACAPAQTGEGAASGRAASGRAASGREVATHQPAQAASSAPSLAAPAPKGAPKSACADGSGLHVLVSPELPRAGEPLRILVAGPVQPASELVLSKDGKVLARSQPLGAAPVFHVLAEVASAEVGTYEARVDAGNGKAACASASVPETPPKPKGPPGRWTAEAAWGSRTEDLYSAWVDRLFAAKPGEDLVFAALHEALRDPKRNFLADHFFRGEDTGADAPLLEPDCADLPFFLRAYFARKLHLPFGYSGCTRGRGGEAPRCLRFYSHQALKPGKHTNTMRAFGEFLRTSVADTVHSGSGRTIAAGDNTDFYPVALAERSLRPGSIYADPYGHMLVVLGRSPQEGDKGGVLFAVDGQPDGTITRKRFWRGQFLFDPEPSLGSPGFKRFRPVVTLARGVTKQLDNAAIAAHEDYGDYSLEQYGLTIAGFYDRMDELLSPAPRDPERALGDALDALEEQVRGRARSVQNGVDYVAKHPAVIEMPDGSKIFETEGAWEDFSTPSRDLRLLIAIDVVTSFPAKVKERPARYRLPAGKAPADVVAGLERLLAAELARRAFEYGRTDGGKQRLTLLEVTQRAAAIEVGWNPNDCPELRWGAAPKSDEAKTCKRRAPADQRGKMKVAQAWFHERKRPPR